MLGSGIGKLNVYVREEFNHENEKEFLIWSNSGNQGKKWLLSQAPVSSKVPYRVSVYSSCVCARVRARARASAHACVYHKNITNIQIYVYCQYLINHSAWWSSALKYFLQFFWKSWTQVHLSINHPIYLQRIRSYFTENANNICNIWNINPTNKTGLFKVAHIFFYLKWIEFKCILNITTHFQLIRP